MEANVAKNAALDAIDINPEGLPDEDLEAASASKQTRLTIAKIKAKSADKKMTAA